MRELAQVYFLKSIDDLPRVVSLILPMLKKARIITLEGDLGAGKTTFVKEVCRQWGIEDLVSSPTFSIVNEYAQPGNELKVYHMDLYRIEHEEELFNMGFEEYIDSGYPVFIEWPAIAINLLPSETIGIHIEIFDNSSRRLKLI